MISTVNFANEGFFTIKQNYTLQTFVAGYKWAWVSFSQELYKYILKSVKNPMLVAKRTNFSKSRAITQGKSRCRVFLCSYPLSPLEPLAQACHYPHKLAPQSWKMKLLLNHCFFFFFFKPLLFRLNSHTTIPTYHSLTICILQLNNVH